MSMYVRGRNPELERAAAQARGGQKVFNRNLNGRNVRVVFVDRAEYQMRERFARHIGPSLAFELFIDALAMSLFSGVADVQIEISHLDRFERSFQAQLRAGVSPQLALQNLQAGADRLERHQPPPVVQNWGVPQHRVDQRHPAGVFGGPNRPVAVHGAGRGSTLVVERRDGGREGDGTREVPGTGGRVRHY